MSDGGPSIIEISDPDDPRLECFRNVRDKDLRGRDRLFLAESEMVVQRLIERTAPLEALLLSPAAVQRMSGVLAQLNATVPVYQLDLEGMCDVAGFHIHRGVLAAGRRPEARATSVDQLIGDLQGRSTLRLLIGESITNIDNMGGLFRTGAAFSVDGIVLDPTCCDPLYRKSIRVSMGHVFSVPWAISSDWPGDLRRLRESLGLHVVAAETTDGARPLWTLEHHDRLAMVVGSEAHGIAPATLNACDETLEIPMAPGVPSLNVATAASVFLYEAQRHIANACNTP